MIRLLIATVFSSVLMGQNDLNNLEKKNPCNHPLIKMAKKKGVRSIPIKDMIKYRRLVKSCAESGDSNLAEQLELMDLERDFKRSKSMANWTSTHAMFSVVTVGYYFMAKILNIPYDVTFFPK